MQKFIDVAARKTMNAMFDVGVVGVASIAFAVFVIVLRGFKVI